MAHPRFLAVLLAVTCVPAPAQDQDWKRYQSGKQSLNDHHWQDAVDSFRRVSAKASTREPALYWLAFALARQGMQEEAAVALAELRRSYPNSGWLREATALESGPLPPEVSQQEELKALAELQVQARREPEAALARARQNVEAPHVPGYKERTVTALGTADFAVTRPFFEELGRGQINPDLRAQATLHLAKVDPNLLVEIYPSSGSFKSFIQAALVNAQQKEQLIAIVRDETNETLRASAMRHAISIGGEAEVAQLLQSERSPYVKSQIETVLQAEAKRFASSLAMIRDSPDPEARRRAALSLSKGGGGPVLDLLASVYRGERDYGVKEAVITALANRRALSTLSALGRDETDLQLKRKILALLAQSDEYVKQMLK